MLRLLVPCMHVYDLVIDVVKTLLSDGHMQLLLHISKGSDSPLHPYLAVLPGLADGTSTPRTGMLLSDTAVKELQYLPLIEDIMNQK